MMKFTHSWLIEHINYDITVKKTAKELTGLGLEVEQLEDLNSNYNNFVVRYNYNYTGKRFITTDNNWYMPANFISNISFSWYTNLHFHYLRTDWKM